MHEPEPIFVTGEFSTNRVLVGTELKVCLSPFGLDISSGRRKSISIYAFTKSMATGLGHAPRKQPNISYAMSGDILGVLHDIYQAGPDFDGDSRTIKTVDLKISYNKACVSFSIVGTAVDDGNVSNSRPADSPRGDWTFLARFSVDASNIRKFYGLYPSAEEFLLKDMSGLAS